MMKNKTLLIYLSISTILAVFMYVLHINLKQQRFIISILNIYIFHFVFSLLVLFAVYFTSKTAYDKTGFAFMAMSVLKMLSAIIFLWPLFKTNQKNLLPEIFNFFVPYFVFLTLEIAFSIKILTVGK